MAFVNNRASEPASDYVCVSDEISLIVPFIKIIKENKNNSSTTQFLIYLSQYLFFFFLQS
jgi:hypothetical protein